MRDECRLRLCEKMRIFGSKRDEVTGEYRELHTEELNDLYSSPNVIWVIKSIRMRREGHVACMREERCTQGFSGETKRERPLRIPRRRWENNIKLDLQEVGCEGIAWIDVTQDTDRFL
jgi:hypothetical protein